MVMRTADSNATRRERPPTWSVKAMIRRVVLASSVVMVVSADVVAQSSTVGDFEKRLEEMRSQIATMQNRIAELEASIRIAATCVTTDAVSCQSAHSPAPG